MSTQEVANRLVELCRTGAYDQAHQELYAADALSIEPEGTPNPRVQGMDAIKAKGEQWQQTMEEVHSSFVNDPIVAGNYFSLTMGYDATMKGFGRVNMEEICVYQVKDGKIVKEQFFYDM